MDSFLKPVIEAGGTLAVATVFLIYIDRQDRRTSTLIGNHLQHSTDSLEKLTVALKELTVIIQGMRRSLKR